MHKPITDARFVVLQFAAKHLFVKHPAIFLVGRVESGRIDGTYFYTSNFRGNPVTLVVDHHCRMIELFVGRATQADVEGGYSLYSTWTTENMGKSFTEVI